MHSSRDYHSLHEHRRFIMKYFLSVVLLCTKFGFLAALPTSGSEKQVPNNEYVNSRETTTYNLHHHLYTMKRSKDVGLDFDVPREIITAGQLNDVTYYNEREMFNIQLKYEPDNTKTLNDDVLRSNEVNEFSIKHQFDSYMKMVQGHLRTGWKKRNAIVATNIALDDTTRDNYFVRANVPSALDGLMKKGYTVMMKSPSAYQLKMDSNIVQDLIPDMLASSDIANLAETLYDHMVRNPRMLDLNRPIIRKYHYALWFHKILKSWSEERSDRIVHFIRFDDKLRDFDSEANLMFKTKFIDIMNSLGSGNFWDKWRFYECEVSSEFEKTHIDILPSYDIVLSDTEINLFVDKIYQGQDEDVIIFDEKDCRIISFQKLAGYVLVSTSEDKKFAFSESFHKIKHENLKFPIPPGLRKIRDRLARRLGRLDNLHRYKIMVFDDSFRTCADGLQFVMTRLPSDIYTVADVKAFVDDFILVVKEPNFEDMAKMMDASLTNIQRKRSYALTYRDVSEWMTYVHISILKAQYVATIFKFLTIQDAPISVKSQIVKRNELCDQLDIFIRSQDDNIIAVTGEVGIGKSSGVASFIEEYIATYGPSTVFWINAESMESIQLSINRFITKSPSFWYGDIKNPTVKQVINGLYYHLQHVYSGVFVFDNVEDDAVIRPYLPNKKLLRNLKIIVTSNTNDPIKHLNPKEITVHEFNADELYSFINIEANVLVQMELIRLRNQPGGSVISWHPSILHYCISFLNDMSKNVAQGVNLGDLVDNLDIKSRETRSDVHPFMNLFMFIQQLIPKSKIKTLYAMSFLHGGSIDLKDYGWSRQSFYELTGNSFLYNIDIAHVGIARYLQEFLLNDENESSTNIRINVINDLLRKQDKMLSKQYTQENGYTMTQPMTVWKHIFKQSRVDRQVVKKYLRQLQIIISGLMTDMENPYIASKFCKTILLKFYEQRENLVKLGKYRFKIFDKAVNEHYWHENENDHVLQKVLQESIQDKIRAIKDLESHISTQIDHNDRVRLKIFQLELMLREIVPKYTSIIDQCEILLRETSGSLELIPSLKLKQIHINAFILQKNYIRAEITAKLYNMAELYLFSETLSMNADEILHNSLIEHLTYEKVTFDGISDNTPAYLSEITEKEQLAEQEPSLAKRRRLNEDNNEQSNINSEPKTSTSTSMLTVYCSTIGGSHSGGRPKRNLECLISDDDIKEISANEIENEHLWVDGDKTMNTLFHNSVYNKEKTAQLSEFLVINKHQIGIRKNNLHFTRMLEGKNAAFEATTTDHSIMPQQKSITTSIEYANHAMMAYAILGAIETCIRNVTSLQCALGVGALIPFPLSIGLKKAAPWLIDSAAIVARAFAPKFTLAVMHTGISVAKFATKALAVAGATFDIIDVGFQVDQLIKCAKGADCSHGEVQDSLVYVVMDGVSLVATALTFAFPIAGLVVGLLVGIARIFYGAHRSVEQMHLRYHTTFSEDWSTFWRTLAFMEPRKEVLELMERTNIENMFADIAWSRLKSLKSDVIGYGILLPSESEATINLDHTLDGVYVSRVRVDVGKLLGTEASMYCEPLFTGESFEFAQNLQTASKMFDCRYGMVVANLTRMRMKRADVIQSIIMDTRYFTNASLTGSRQYDNIFSIVSRDYNMTAKYQGRLNLVITGGKSVTNIFVIQSIEYLTACTFKGGESATNIIEFLALDGIVMVDVVYTEGVFSLSLDNMEEDYRLISDDYDPSIDNRTYKVIGNYGTPMNITCTTQWSEKTYEQVIISSNGGNASIYDEIVNCDHVILSPYSRFSATSYEFNRKAVTYYLYVTRSITNQLNSSMLIDLGRNNQGVIKFLDFNLIGPNTNYSFDNTTSTFNITFKLTKDDFLTVVVLNYSPIRIALLDQWNNEIQPAVTANADNAAVAFHVSKKINLVEVRLEQPTLECFLGQDIDLSGSKVSATLNIVRRDDKPVATYRWGSRDKDVLVVPSMAKVPYILRGDNGCDVYIIEPSDERREVKIVNNATDDCLDMLVIKSTQTHGFPSAIRRRDSNAFIYIDATNVEIADYYAEGPSRQKHRHLLLMNYATGEVFLPREDDFILFVVPTPDSSHFEIDANSYQNGIAINATKNDITLYRSDNDNDLILASDSFINAFFMTVKNYAKSSINITFHNSVETKVEFFNLQSLPRIEDNRMAVVEFNFDTSATLNLTASSILLKTTAEPKDIAILAASSKNTVVFYSSDNYLTIDWRRVPTLMLEFANSRGPSIFVYDFNRFSITEGTKMEAMLRLAAKNREIQSSLTLSKWTAITCHQMNNMKLLPPEQFKCLGFHSYTEVHDFQNYICPEYNKTDVSQFADIFKQKTSNTCKLTNMEIPCERFIIPE